MIKNNVCDLNYL